MSIKIAHSVIFIFSFVLLLAPTTATAPLEGSSHGLPTGGNGAPAAQATIHMMGAIGMGDWKMESARPMEMGGQVAQAKPIEKKIGSLLVTVSTMPESAKLGDNTLRIHVKDITSKPVTDATVSIEYTMDMPGMPIDKAEAKHTTEGIYETPVRFTMAGPWGVSVNIQRPGQAEVRERFTVSVEQ